MRPLKLFANKHFTQLDCMITFYEPAFAAKFTPLEIYEAIHNPKVMKIVNLLEGIRMHALKFNNSIPTPIIENIKPIEAPLDLKEFLTTQEAARFLSLSNQSLLNMTSNGHVPVYKLGRRNRYRLQDLKDLLLTNRRGGF